MYVYACARACVRECMCTCAYVCTRVRTCELNEHVMHAVIKDRVQCKMTSYTYSGSDICHFQRC